MYIFNFLGSYPKCLYYFSHPQQYISSSCSPHPCQYLILVSFLMVMECDQVGWKVLEYKMNFGKLIKSIDKSSFFLFSLPHKLYFLTQIHSGLHLVIKFSQTYPIFFHWPPRDLIKNPAVKAAGLCNRNDAHFQKDMVVKAPELPVPWPKIEIDTELIKLINVFVFSWGKHKGPQR